MSTHEHRDGYRSPGWRVSLRGDLISGLVVFLVAVPLCLGIAFASGVSPMNGLLAGVIGGVVVGALSGSNLSVSGPAAGLIVVVTGAIQDLGSIEGFLTALVLAGILQIVFGFLRAGIVSHFIPVAVIKGMLAGIGMVLLLKQIPHALGYDANYEGDLTFAQMDGHNTFTEIPFSLGHMHLGAAIIAVVGLLVLLAWPHMQGRFPGLKTIPAQLMVVLSGIVTGLVFAALLPMLSLHAPLLVAIPEPSELLGALRLPEWGVLGDPTVYRVAVVLALVASIETLLSIEAVDKLDPYNRSTPANRELKAQGVGNVLAGLLGAIPITSVIIRSSANLQAGGKTKTAAVFHGALLFICVLAIPGLLNLIPLATLAVILLDVGYKLTRISLFRKMYADGMRQFVPFVCTSFGVLFTDLLTGVLVGMLAAIFFILRAHAQASYGILRREERHDGFEDSLRVVLSDNVSFLNKASLTDLLHGFSPGSKVTLDASHTRHIDQDILDLIDDFAKAAPLRQVELSLVGFAGRAGENMPSQLDAFVRPHEYRQRRRHA